MPELPDVTVYVERLNALVAGQRLQSVRITQPFLLRTVEPAVDRLLGAKLACASRLSKRIVLTFDNQLVAVMHLMIAGRLRWRPVKPGAKPRKPLANSLAVFEFDNGNLFFTEAGKKRRASLHIIDEGTGLAQFDRGGLELASSDALAFWQRLQEENHTLKRALTDQRIISGIGNAYSDEILHRAQMSPFTQTKKLTQRQGEHLFRVCVEVLDEWIARLRAQTADKFPEKVTAFHEDMAVHGRYRQPCPTCGAPVQRIRYADNESNYCANCQTGGKLYADRALSRLLKANWPKTIDELENQQ